MSDTTAWPTAFEDAPPALCAAVEFLLSQPEALGATHAVMVAQGGRKTPEPANDLLRAALESIVSGVTDSLQDSLQ